MGEEQGNITIQKLRTLESFLKSINFNKKADQTILSNIEQLYNGISTDDREEQVKNHIVSMIKAFGGIYTTKLAQNNIDLIVKHNNKLVAIFECKALDNEAEMLTQEDLNKKALWELIANFLLLYEKKVIPDYLVASNGKNWFIFNKGPFIKFANNQQAQDYFGFGKIILPFQSTRENFYKSIKKFLKEHPDVLKSFADNCWYASKPEEIYFFLSPDILLNQYNPNAGNTLNKDFYNELLYIFGLEEKEEKNKKTIVPNGVSNTFCNQILKKLQKNGGNKKENFEKALELIIIWLNRILFLKLFEARLVLFNNDSPAFKFLNTNMIPDTSTLGQLFFDVLAVPESERNQDSAYDKFRFIPYLNSSLFEEKELEKEIHICDIAGNSEVDYFKNTVLKDDKGKPRVGRTKLLEYLFEFLDAYNFGEDDSRSSSISPQVLGLIFEKLNGYKDGSYYTPNTITDYMAKTAIEEAILAKAKDQAELDYSDFNDFITKFPEFEEEKRKKIKEIIKNLTILDPAVGSGHFLVSALNVLLKMWYDFGIIYEIIPSNAISNIKTNYSVEFEGNSIKFFKNGKPFVYRRGSQNQNDATQNQNDATQNQYDAIFQEAIFKAKKAIIENNLFGVDLNSKAVEIARLRMWIELLENAYYKTDGTMETLPNIDINIHVGDSLLAPILEKQLFVVQNVLADYKSLFKRYQETDNKKERQEINKKLMEDKNKLIANRSTQYSDLIWNIDFPHTLDDEGNFKGFDIIIANPPYIQLRNNNGKLADLYEGLNFEVFERSSDIYALFIEKAYNLLSDNGILCFITSNKWMRAGYGKSLRRFLKEKTIIKQIIDFGEYRVFPEATVDTNILVALKPTSDAIKKGINETNKFKFLNVKEDEFVNYGGNIQEYFSKEQQTMQQCDLSEDNFVLADNSILALRDKIESVGKPLNDWKVNINMGIITGFNEVFIIDDDTKNEILKNCAPNGERERTEEIIKPVLRGRDIEKWKYEYDKKWLINLYAGWTKETFKGLNVNFEQAFMTNFPSLYNYFMSKEDLTNKDGYNIFTRPGKGDFWWETVTGKAVADACEKEKIVWQRVAQKPKFALVSKEFFGENFYCEATTFFITSDLPVYKFLLGIFNSKLFEYTFYKFYMGGGIEGEIKGAFIGRFPVPLIDTLNYYVVSKIEYFVNQILETKKNNPNADVSSLEREIDQWVYQLYGLTNEEIKIIEGGN